MGSIEAQSFLGRKLPTWTTRTLVLIHATKLGIDLGILVSGDLDQIVPVHDWSYLVLEATHLLHLFVGCNHHPLVLHFLAGSLGAVV